jgi:uncharacterized protein involved in exopolysaccharide biosynthesis
MFQYDTQSPLQSSGPAGPERFGLLDIPLALWRHKLLIIGLPIIFGLLAALATALMQDKYSATSQILIDPRELRVLFNEVSPQGLNSDATAAYIESQARIIASTDMLRRVTDRENLTRDSEYVGSTSPLARLFPQGERKGDATLRVMEQLRRNLFVRRGERTFVIDVAVTASDPDKAARLANTFSTLYLEDQANSRSEQARRANTGLTSRLNELRDRVRTAEDKIEAYKGLKNIVGASGKLVTEEQLAGVNAQLALARSRLADAKARLDQVERIRGDQVERGALPEAVNSQTLGLLRQQLGEAQRRSATLATSLGPLHPDFLAVQSSLRDAQRGVADEISRIRQAARADFERAQSNERTIVQQVDGLKKDTLSSGRDTVELRELERELEANRAVYQSFLQRARETSEQERVDTSNVRIITTAIPPLEKIAPQRRLIVTGAVMGGLALGILLALLSEIASNTREARTWRNQMAQMRPVMQPQPVYAPQTAPAAAAMSQSMERLSRTVQPVQQTTDPLSVLEPRTLPASPAPRMPTQAAQPVQPVAPVSDTQDLMRLLKVLGQLEKVVDQYGMPQKI